MEALNREGELRVVMKNMVDGEIVFLTAGEGEIHIEIAFIVTNREHVVGLAQFVWEERTGGLEGETLGAIVAEVVGCFLADHGFRRLGNHVHHAARRRATVDGSIGSLNDFNAVDVARAIAPEAKEAVAQLSGGGEAAQHEIAADIQTGEAADLGQIVGKIEDTEVLQVFAGHDVHRVRKIDDLRPGATAGHRLSRPVVVVAFRRHLKWREFNYVGFGRTRGGRGLSEKGCSEEDGQEGGDQSPVITSAVGHRIPGGLGVGVRWCAESADWNAAMMLDRGKGRSNERPVEFICLS